MRCNAPCLTHNFPFSLFHCKLSSPHPYISFSLSPSLFIFVSFSLSVQVGYGNAAGSAIFLTSFLGVFVFRRCVSDVTLILIGMLSFASGIYFMSFVTATYMFYLGKSDGSGLIDSSCQWQLRMCFSGSLTRLMENIVLYFYTSYVLLELSLLTVTCVNPELDLIFSPLWHRPPLLFRGNKKTLMSHTAALGDVFFPNKM